MCAVPIIIIIIIIIIIVLLTVFLVNFLQTYRPIILLDKVHS